MSEENISQACCEAILNTDFSTAKGKKDFRGNVNADMTNHRTLEVHEKCIDTKTSDVGNLENYSLQDASTINDDDWSAEPHHLLVVLLAILLVRLVKAQVREWKKEKRRKDPRSLKRIRSHSSFLGTEKPRRSLFKSRNQYGRKSFWKSGWIFFTVSCGLCFRSSMAASTAPTSKPKTDVLNARVNETLSISCGGMARSTFKWICYVSSGKKPLYASADIRNYTNTNPLITFFPNGTFIFQSVQVSDMGDYICIAYDTETTQFEYSLIVQNLTVNHSQGEVKPESIPESKHGAEIGGGVFGGLVAFAVVAGLVCCVVKKWRSRTCDGNHTGSVSAGNGASSATEITESDGAHTTTIPMLNGHQSQLRQ